MKRTSYDINLLKYIIQRDKCKIELSDYIELPKLTRNTRINFVCNCEKEYEKEFRMYYNV